MRKKKYRNTETLLVRQVMEYLEIKKVMCWRTNNIAAPGRTFHGTYGVPDIIAVAPNGVIIGIECKSKRGKLTEHQELFGDRLREAGGIYIIVRQIDDIIEELNKMNI